MDNQTGAEPELSEFTVGIIKPDVASTREGTLIKGEIKKFGLWILKEKTITLDEETVKLLFNEEINEPYFPDLLKLMTR